MLERPAKSKSILLLTACLSMLALLIALSTILAVASVSPLLDFTIYHGAAQRVLANLTPYAWYGPYHLPYQYAIWTSWLLAPFGLLSLAAAWSLFVTLNLILLVVLVVCLCRLHGMRIDPEQYALMLSASLLMSWLVFHVGQIDILMLGILMLVIWATATGRDVLAGSLVPLALIKPHLLILFLPALWLCGGRRMLASSLTSFAVFAALGFMVHDTWLSDLVQIFLAGQSRDDVLVWTFSTAAGALSISQLWNLLLIPLGIAVLLLLRYRLHSLPTAAWLSISLALSLACAPYSFAYDLPMLIPALVWLSSTRSRVATPLWLLAAIAPWLSRFGTPAFLLTVLVCCIGVAKALAVARDPESTAPIAPSTGDARHLPI